LEPSAICRAECFSCPKNKLKRKSGLMPLQTFNKAYSEFDKSSEARFIFSGIGEPLLNPALSDMVSLASTSSSMLVTSLQQMPDSGFNYSALDQIRISVDALEAKSFEKKRSGCNWKNIEQFISEFSALKAEEPDKYPELGVTMVRHGLNQKEALAFLNYWKKVTTPPYQQWFFRWPFSKKPDKIQWYQILGENTFARQLPKTSAIDFTPVKRRPCKHALTSVSILWNGDVSLCPFDFQGKMILGNVNEQNLMEIWHSDKARAIRHAHLSQNLPELPAICAGCTDWYHNL
jgi:radical SAM protein with 4Fe4S-binding SPASM domain